ncbi:MAG: hypothetical protein Tsb0017_26380 [Geothermobacteraceae bacterium]
MTVRSLLVVLLLVLCGGPVFADEWQPRDPVKIQNRGGQCLDCHREATPGIYRDWLTSRHALLNITCVECHKSSQANPMTRLHQGRFYITPLVPMKVCARCHNDEAVQYRRSAHGQARARLEKFADDDPRALLLAEARLRDFDRCGGCHGQTLSGEPSEGWRLAGAEPVFPDGSRGSCSGCHRGHRFDMEQVRRPETCTACHEGRFYPEADLFHASTHGRQFAVRVRQADLSARGHLLEVDRIGAPSCALCHMNGSAVGLLTTHDPGERLTRSLAAPWQQARPDADQRRDRMLAVCSQCHGSRGARAWLAEADEQFDAWRGAEVQTGLDGWRQRIEAARYDAEARRQALDGFAAWLADIKSRAMNLYMGRRDAEQR